MLQGTTRWLKTKQPMFRYFHLRSHFQSNLFLITKVLWGQQQGIHLQPGSGFLNGTFIIRISQVSVHHERWKRNSLPQRCCSSFLFLLCQIVTTLWQFYDNLTTNFKADTTAVFDHEDNKFKVSFSGLKFGCQQLVFLLEAPKNFPFVCLLEASSPDQSLIWMCVYMSIKRHM